MSSLRDVMTSAKTATSKSHPPIYQDATTRATAVNFGVQSETDDMIPRS